MVDKVTQTSDYVRQRFPRPCLCGHNVVSDGVSDKFGVAPHAESLLDFVLVVVRRPVTQMQDGTDFLYHLAFCQQLQNLTLPICEPLIYADQFLMLPPNGIDRGTRHRLGQVGFSP